MKRKRKPVDYGPAIVGFGILAVVVFMMVTMMMRGYEYNASVETEFRIKCIQYHLTTQECIELWEISQETLR